MRKMSYFILAALAVVAMGAVIMGCQSCYRANSKGMPADIADAKLVSYKYTLQGTERWPLHSENVELCKDDSSRCIIRLFDQARMDPVAFDIDGDPLPDTLIVSSAVLDSIKQMIVDAQAWRFKEDYSPRMSTMDGQSWGYTATFSVTDAMLEATPEAQRPRLMRHGGRTLSSGGSNAQPDTQLFEQIRLYLQSLYDSANPK